MLTLNGYRTVAAADGIAGLAAARTENPAVILTDLAMPGMTGWDVARAVKDAAPGVRVVLVRGFGVEVSPEDLRAHGVDLVLAKPLKIQDIQAAIAMKPSATAIRNQSACSSPAT